MSTPWVTIAHLSNQQEYLLARARLESAGIECFSPNENAAWPMIHSIAGAAFVLQVRPEQAEDARALLDDPGDPFLVSE